MDTLSVEKAVLEEELQGYKVREQAVNADKVIGESLDAVPFDTFENSQCKQAFDKTPYPDYDFEVTASVHAFINILPQVPGANVDPKECEL